MCFSAVEPLLSLWFIGDERLSECLLFIVCSRACLNTTKDTYKDMWCLAESMQRMVPVGGTKWTRHFSSANALSRGVNFLCSTGNYFCIPSNLNICVFLVLGSLLFVFSAFICLYPAIAWTCVPACLCYPFFFFWWWQTCAPLREAAISQCVANCLSVSTDALKHICA